jgi:site-specific DNA recombinase
MHRRLTAQGIPPRKATRGHWAHSRVIELLRDPLYKGEASDNRPQPRDVRRPYGPRRLKDRHPGNGQGRLRRPQADWIPVRVPALSDPEPWERAQAQRVQNRERAQRHHTQHRDLLRSLLVCGRGGRRMVGTWSAQGGRSICALRYPRYVPGACTGRRRGAATIAPGVWAQVKALVSDPAGLRMPYERGHGEPAVDVRADQERTRLERKRAAFDRERTRLIAAQQAGVIELDELAARRQRIEEQGRMLRARVQEIAPPSCGSWKESTPFAPVSGEPWKTPLSRCSSRWYSSW